MAARVNTKVVLILVVALVGAGVLFAGLAYLSIRGNAERHVKKAEEAKQLAMDAKARGDMDVYGEKLRAAKDFYARAVGKDPANRVYLNLMEETLLEIVPYSTDEAAELYKQRLSVLSHEVTHFPHDGGAQMRLMRELLLGARVTDMTPRWQMVRDAAQAMLEKIPESDPNHPYGYLFRGMSGLAMVEQLEPADVLKAEADLEKFVELVPDSDEGWAALAWGQATIGAFLGSQERTIQGEAGGAVDAIVMFQKLDETLRKAVEMVPDGPDTATMVVQRLAGKRAENEASVGEEELNQAIDRMVRLVRGTDDLHVVAKAANLLRILNQQSARDSMLGEDAGDEAAADTPDRGEQSIELLQACVDENPDALNHRWLLARALFDEQRWDDAEAAARAAIEADPLPVCLLAQFERLIKSQAAMVIVNVHFTRWELADEADRPAVIEDIVAARDLLQSIVPDPENDVLLTEANGKLAWARDDYAEATKHFEKLLSMPGSDAEVQLYYMAGRCLKNLNQPGRAHERLTEAVEALEQKGGFNAVLLMEKAELELEMRRFQDMLETVGRVLAVEEDNEQAKSMKEMAERQLAAAEGRREDPIFQGIEDANRAVRQGDEDTGRTMLENMLADNPADLRLLLALFELELNTGNKDQASEYLNRALEISPDHPRLLELTHFIATDDPIERLREYIATAFEDPIERTVQLHVNYRLFAEQHLQRAAELEERGQTEAAAASRELASRASAEAERYLADVLRDSPDHPMFVESQFQEALVDGDDVRAEQLADKAVELNVDRVNGLTFQARLEMSRGNLDAAIRSWEQATAITPYSAPTWAALASAYRMAGNLTEAEHAYEQAYRSNPNDMRIVQEFLPLLMQSGKKTRALLILQNARLVDPTNIGIRDTWLALEEEIGDLPMVLRTRRRLFQDNPDDLLNAMRLVSLLGRLEPQYDLLLDAEGKRRYMEASWQRLQHEEQERILAQARQRWNREADEILDLLFEKVGENLGLVRLKAQTLRLRGEAEAGEQLFQDFIDRHDESELTSEMLIRHAEYQLECFRVGEALRTLEHARQYQDPEVLEVDAQLADLHYRANRYLLALEFYTGIDAVNPSRATSYRIVECLVKLHRLDEAEARLAESMEGKEEEFTTCMLRATILEGRAQDAYASGDKEGADRYYAEYFAALERAKAYEPTLHVPYLLKANALLTQFRRGQGEPGMRSLLEDALAELNRAETVRVGEPEIVLARAEVLVAGDDARGAIGELTDFLESHPDNLKARKRLVEILWDQKRWVPAHTIIGDGIEVSGDLALWHEMRGDTYFQEASVGSAITPERRNELMTAAITAYEEAYLLRPNLTMFIKLIDVRMGVADPDYELVIDLLEPKPDLMEMEPTLRILYAKALNRVGRREQGLNEMRRAYGRMIARVANEGVHPSTLNGWFLGLGQFFGPTEADQAEALVMELCRNQPSIFEYTWLIRVWKETGPSGFDRAIKLCHEALEKCPPDRHQARATIYQSLGEIHVFRGDWEAAGDAYAKVIELMPDNAAILNDYAYLRAEYLEDPAGALPFVERASRLSPDKSSIMDTHGWVLYRLGRIEDAWRKIRAAAREQNSSVIQLHLAHVLVARNQPGDLEEAQRALTRALEMKPDPTTQAEIEALADDIRTRRGQGG